MSTTELVKVGSTFIDVLRTESAGWVLVKPLCDKLGIGYEAQRKRLQTSSWATTSIFEAVAADGRVREMLCLRVDCVGMWLATLDGLRIKNETVRSMIRELQADAKDALDRWFRGPDAAPPAPALPPVRPVAPAQWTAGDSSSLDLVEHMVRAMRSQERAQAELAAVQASQALEISSLKQVRTEVLAESVAAAPEGLFPVAYDKERLYIRKTVNAWMQYRGCDNQTAWREAYTLLLDIGGFDARKRCNNQVGPVSKRLNKLGIVAKEHKMMLFASIVKQHMGDVMERAQTALVARAQAAGSHFHA